jgi:hypothetical protein
MSWFCSSSVSKDKVAMISGLAIESAKHLYICGLLLCTLLLSGQDCEAHMSTPKNISKSTCFLAMFVLSWPPNKSKLKPLGIHLMGCFVPDTFSHLSTDLFIKNTAEPPYVGSLLSSKQQSYPRMAFCFASCLINIKYLWNSFCSSETQKR